MVTIGLTLICIALACFMALYAFRSQDLAEENTSLCLQLADKIKAEGHLFENLRRTEQERDEQKAEVFNLKAIIESKTLDAELYLKDYIELRDRVSLAINPAPYSKDNS